MFKWYNCTDDKKKLDKSPVLISTDDETIIFGDCSILSPVLKAKTYSGNYVYIEQFNRYYFITDVVWSKGYYYINTTVDAMYSNNTSINNMECLITRSEKFNNANIPDNNIAVNLRYSVYGKNFGQDITTNDTSYILGVI